MRIHHWLTSSFEKVSVAAAERFRRLGVYFQSDRFGRRHKYDYKVHANTAGEKVVELVGAGKRVLELGPGPGSITRLLKDNGCSITALELDEDAIAVVAEFCEQVHNCNLNDADWPDLLADAGRFEVIVATDVLEHLYDPWRTLERMLPLLADEGHLVISLPHVAHSAVLACLLHENFEYQPWGLLDKTHIRFFGLKDMQKMFEESGYKIIDAGFVVKEPEDTEFANRWRALPEEVREALSWNPFGSVYQTVIKAVPKTAAGIKLRLDALEVPAAGTPAGGGIRRNRLVRFFVSRMSLNTRRRISSFLERLGIRL
jgi:2-polyprenyl-3-methyl-5-hydroxy-6-metoxy-1,4-benzoquinol methylase